MNKERHNPDPEFVSRLEWQLRSEYRRQQRFDQNGSSGRPRWNAWLRTAALVLVSLALGVAGVKATQHFENSWRKDLLLARTEASSELAHARLQISREMLATVAKQVKAGVAGLHDLSFAELEVKKAQAEAKRLELDLDEIQLSGSSPRHELSAPLAGGRDFVSERLQIDLQQVEERAQVIRLELELALKRMKAGVADRMEVAHVEQELKKLEMQSDSIRKNLELREAFLEGEIGARQVDLTNMLIEAQSRQRRATAASSMHRLELERATHGHKVGTVSVLELRQVEFQTKVAETEARLAEMEVQLLQKELQK